MFLGNNALLGGGAIYGNSGKTLIFEDYGFFGGDSGAGGGAISINGSKSASFDRCSFDSNQAQRGGAIFACNPNSMELKPSTFDFASGELVGLVGTSTGISAGTVLYFVGVGGTDSLGCGTAVPGVGEVLLGLAPAPYYLATTAMTMGESSLSFPVPRTSARACRARPLSCPTCCSLS